MTQYRLIGPVVAMALLAGCQQVAVAPTVGCDFTPMLTAQRSPEPVIVAPTPGTMSEIPLNAVSITDGAITNKVLVQTSAARRSPTGTVEVMTRLVNCTDFPLQVEGRTHFLDEDQSPTEPVSAWHRVFLPARALGTYRETSTDAQRVVSFLIELREGR